MIALDDEIGAAAQAVDLGMQSTPSQLGPVIGEGFNLPEGTPALRPGQAPRLIPDYGSPAVGGSVYHQGCRRAVADADGAGATRPALGRRVHQPSKPAAVASSAPASVRSAAQEVTRL